ncbi:hypothetical protein Ddc_00660 [Ditylenchus destructor]|nr:hypothetical protein Ddc_00660 [Ditylenchus destructor]
MNSSREPELLQSSKRPPAYRPVGLPANNASSTISKSVIEQKKKSFVFGSSTPRELSHIDKVERKNRLIDGSVTSRESNKGRSNNERGIVYYMRQARSITPARGDRNSSWAFGSSTPRELSHLKNIRSDQRVYDAKISHKPETKSITTSLIVEKSSKSASKQNNTGIGMSNHVKRTSTRVSRDDDASSEPDIVQDRATDFQRNINKPKKEIGDTKKTEAIARKEQNKTNKEQKTYEKSVIKTMKKIENAISNTKCASPEKTDPKKLNSQDDVCDLATEARQPVVLINETHEAGTNEKAVHNPTIKAHSDTSAVLLDDDEIEARPSPVPTPRLDAQSMQKDGNSTSDEVESNATNSNPPSARMVMASKETSKQQAPPDSGR